jgi:hypothetical protein
MADIRREHPAPRAILVVSAHWYTNLTAVTAMARPRTIQDFYGFPDELFAVEYPAPGAPAFAEQLAEIAKPTMVGLDTDVWGLDHGTWSLLIHVFPEPTSRSSSCRSMRRSRSTTTSSWAPSWRRCATEGCSSSAVATRSTTFGASTGHNRRPGSSGRGASTTPPGI